MHSIMNTDITKLILLGIVTAACLGTIFISPTTTMNNPNMRILASNTRQFCKVPREAVQKCSNNNKKKNHDNSDVNCNQAEQSLQKCQNVVNRAFQHINLGGCPHQIKALTLCEDEWCNSHDVKSCQEECNGVREPLSVCIRQHVTSFFQRNGLNDDGSLAG
jgi:hypothetical protein